MFQKMLQGGSGGSASFKTDAMINQVPLITSSADTRVNQSSYASNMYGTFYGYLAFDQNSGTNWIANTIADEWISFDFSEPKVINMCAIMAHTGVGGTRIKDFRIEGSNDGVNFNDVVFSGTYPDVADINYYFVFENTKSYRYYRLYVVNTYGSQGVAIKELTFFGA